MNNFEPVIFAGLVLVTSLLAVSNIRLRIRNKKLVIQNAQEILNRNVIAQKLKEELSKKENIEIEKTDGFLKFISDSRDWAFKYIESVQKELLEFDQIIQKRFDYANKYIRSTGKSVALDIINEIYDAYQKLRALLPDDNKEKNK